MFNTATLSIVISLVFVYLLYSLLASIIQELVATNFSFRAKILERAIFRMLQDEMPFRSMSRFNAAARLLRSSQTDQEKPTSFFSTFYQHPIIKFLSDGTGHKKPSYIRKETFSKVVIDLLTGNDAKPGEDIRPLIQDSLDNNSIKWIANDEGQGNRVLQQQAQLILAKIRELWQEDEPSKLLPFLKELFKGRQGNMDLTYAHLKSLWRDSQGDVQKFKIYLEQWFDETMERATGWYKQYTQLFLLIIGFVIACVFNVDTILIAKKLEKDPALRDKLVEQADNFMKTHPNILEEYSEKLESIDTIKYAGILRDNINAEYKSLKARQDILLSRADSLVKNDIANVNNLLGIERPYCNKEDSCKECISGFLKDFWSHLLGYILTALAISLGAPFWFDLLNKLMQLRNSVAPKQGEESKNEGDAKPGEVPQIKRKG